VSDNGPLPTTPGERPAPPLGRAVGVYTGLRLVLFVGLAAVLVLAGVPVFPALVGALLGSMLGSLALLRRQRDDLAAALLARRDRSAARRAHEERVREHVQRTRRGQEQPPSA
jgi:flagellar biosynthesis component FlhA